MLISVIMGVYNTERTVVASIDSIFAQTYQNFELIVCDDGSTDSTFSKLIACQECHGERMIILKNERNIGLAATLNRCLKIARGDMIARMDGDDESLPERFAIQIDYMHNNQKIAFVGSNAIKFNEEGIHGYLNYPEQPNVKDLVVKNCFVHPTIMIQKAVLTSVGRYNESKYATRCEDYDLWFRLYSQGYKGVNLQVCLLRYYEGSANLHKRKFRYRVCEMIVRYFGITSNRLPWYYLIYILRPLLIGCLPRKLVRLFKR